MAAWQNGLVGKDASCQAWSNLSLIPGTYMAEGENQFPQVALWPSHVSHGMWMHVRASCKCMTCVQVRREARRGHQMPGAGATGSVYHLAWVLGTSFGSFGRAASALNCWAISPAPMWSFWEWFYGHCVDIVDSISSETFLLLSLLTEMFCP